MDKPKEESDSNKAGCPGEARRRVHLRVLLYKPVRGQELVNNLLLDNCSLIFRQEWGYSASAQLLAEERTFLINLVEWIHSTYVILTMA